MSRLVVDGGVWVSNVAVSVAITFVNKILLSRSGYGFVYVTTLCALHFQACSVGIIVYRALSTATKKQMPLPDLAVFTLVADAAVISLNLSLMLNPVALYQIAKLLVIPFIASVEFFWLKYTFSSGKIVSMAMVVGGVATVTVADIRTDGNLVGICMAGLSVVTSGMQQILCRTMQQKHKLTSDELLAHTAPAQGWTLLIISPFLDYYLSRRWVFDYEWMMPAIYALLASCFCAVMVNVTQYACLGRFSAGSFQVMSHSKTLLILLGGWAFLGELVSTKQLGGIFVAVLGMVAYGVATSRQLPLAQKVVSSTKSAESPLLNGERLLPQSKESVSTGISGP